MLYSFEVVSDVTLQCRVLICCEMVYSSLGFSVILEIICTNGRIIFVCCGHCSCKYHVNHRPKI